jgi:hypothetical protein
MTDEFEGHGISSYKISLLKQFRGIIAVYSESNIEPTHKFCTLNQSSLMLNRMAHRVTTVVHDFKCHTMTFGGYNDGV